MFEQKILREYKRARAQNWTAIHAFHHAKTKVLFDNTPGVRLCVECDPDPECCLDVECSDKEKKELIKRVNQEGAWALVSYVQDIDGEWNVVDSCGGFIGEDWEWSGYEADLMNAALKEREKIFQQELLMEW